MSAKERKFIYSFKEGNAGMKDLLGGKGANLAQMASNGVPVPPGFTITTAACLEYLEKKDAFIQELWPEIEKALHALEEVTGKTFGKGENPLLVSVRSGAPVSMPGMMDTILNLGINEETAKTLQEATSNERFVLDNWRRFIQMFGNVVKKIPGEEFEKVLEETKSKRDLSYDYELNEEDLRNIIQQFKGIYSEKTGEDFPEDPMKQLKMAITAVFASWDNPRARTYRKMNRIPSDMGTAVNVVSMVYGNMGNSSGTGVCFSRNPATGEKKLYGEFLINAQGEDVVSGARTPEPIDDLKDLMPQVYEELDETVKTLESYFKDMQDIEFTVEEGKLFILQTRTGKRSANAAINIAVDFVSEGILDKKEAVSRIEPDQVERVLHDQFDPDSDYEVAAKGLPASPGAAVGQIVFDPDEAVTLHEQGKSLILARPETTPDDVHGLYASVGVLTTRGGMTSHAAVVARGVGKPCISGCDEVTIDLDAETLKIGEVTLQKGDILSIDGTTGEVVIGEVPLVEPDLSENFRTFLSWCDSISTMEVWGNADTPEDVARAKDFGAKGIGLCRTEHMFMAEDRLPVMQEMIISEDESGRKDHLEKLRIMQKEDFRKIFEAMDPFPVIIRLLDPPLHEFLPDEKELQEYLSDLENTGYKNSEEGLKVRRSLEMTRKLREANPMLGFRGCRLGIIYPEIYEMQTRAIFDAASEAKTSNRVIPYIMIPLVMLREEYVKISEKIASIGEEYGLKEHEDYMTGTMIEIPRAALIADELAEKADFFSFGTNDLTQTTLGLSRDDSETGFLLKYIEQGLFSVNPFHTLDRKGTGYIMEVAIERAKKARRDLSFGICGEHGGDPESIAYCNSLELHYVSCSPFRVPVARLASAHSALGIIK
jgi:pyruvate,orthophosphate dikinase